MGIFSHTKTRKSTKDGENFVTADFVRCLPKEKTFKKLSLNLNCFDNALETSQEEADRVCDELLTLSCGHLHIGVCGAFSHNFVHILTWEQFCGEVFPYERLLAQSNFKEMSFGVCLLFC